MRRPVSRRVQADGGLVEHVAGAHQARAEAGGELDALGLAAGERGGEAVEGEVFEADVVEELEALADFDQDLVGDGGLFGRERRACRRSRSASAMFMRTTSARFLPPTRT